MGKRRESVISASDMDPVLGYFEVPVKPSLTSQQLTLNNLLEEQAQLLNQSGISDLVFSNLTPVEQTQFEKSKIKLVNIPKGRIDLMPAGLIAACLYCDERVDSQLVWDWTGRPYEDSAELKVIPLVGFRKNEVIEVVPQLKDTHYPAIFDGIRLIGERIVGGLLPDVHQDTYTIAFEQYRISSSQLKWLRELKATSSNFIAVNQAVVI